jgi:hypothetical protein
MNNGENSEQPSQGAVARVLEEVKASAIVETKGFRVELDVALQKIKNGSCRSRERNLAITKLQEAIMWLGMDLKELGAPNPYPNSYKPENTTVDPTADGMKM